MRRTSPHILLALAALLWLLASVSCSDRSAMRQLQAVEAILDDAPDDARARLDSIDASALQGESRALYAMLKTQADYKCYVDISSDSLIREATTYYGTRRKSWRAAMSWYSLGCISQVNGEELVAIDAYLKSLPLFPDATVKNYALCLQNIGDIYVSRMMFDEADSAIDAVLSHPECKVNSKMYYYETYSLGLNALHNKRFDRADSIFTSLLASADENLSDYYKSNVLLQFAKISLYGHKDYHSAIKYIDEYLKVVDNPENSGAGLSVKGDAYYSMQNYDSALVCYERSMMCDEELYTCCDNAYHLAMIAGRLGLDANPYIEKYNLLRDSISAKEHIQEMDEISQNHKILLMQNALRTSHKRTIAIIASCFVLLFISVVQYYYTKRKSDIEKIARQEKAVYDSNIDALEIKVREMSAANPEARKALLNLYTERLNSCRDVFSRTSYFNRLAQIKSNSGTVELSQGEKSCIIEAVRHSFQDSINDIYAEIPSARDEDVITLILSYLNCGNDIIAELSTVTYGAISKRKYRLSGKAPADFLKLFL